jgi:hypothetical protein
MFLLEPDARLRPWSVAILSGYNFAHACDRNGDAGGLA